MWHPDVSSLHIWSKEMDPRIPQRKTDIPSFLRHSVRKKTDSEASI